MAYKPHKKQVAAHLAFLTQGFKRGVLLMGRQCLAGDTLVSTDSGMIPIADIMVGDRVLSFDGDYFEYRDVINTWDYGVDVEPKPMLEYEIYGQKIKTTYDHPYFYSNEWVPIYQLAWGSMASSDRQKLKLLCEQYGQALDYESSWLKGENSCNEASFRPFRVPEDSSGRENSKNTSVSSRGMGVESREQTGGQSQRLQPSKQLFREFGVGNSSREYSALSQDGSSGQKTGRGYRYPYTQRSPSSGNSSRSTPQTTDSRAIRGFLVHNPRRTTPTKLVSHITVLESEPTFAIDVEGNHNYCITESEILVGNSGKTYFATNHGWLSAVIEQGRYFVVFKTYKQAHEVVWRQYIPLIPKELIYKKNEQDLLIEFHYIEGPVTLPDGTVVQVEHDESKPRSTLQLLGSDQADSHRGFRANGIIYDEYADQDPNNWDAVYKHFFSTTNGWAIFMGTPRGYNHFYDLIQFAQEDERWFYQEATWRDSPYVSREFIQEERKEAEKTGKLSTFLQEVELEFRAVQGAVYPQFDRKVHIVRPSDIPPLAELSVYAGIDFGWHTTAVPLVGIDHDQNWWVFDEVYGRETILKDVMPRVRDKLADNRLVLMVGDSQAKDAIETLVAEGWPITPVVKRDDSIIHGIDLIRQKLKPRIQLVGKPKPTIFFSSVCKNIIQEMEAYKYPEDKPDRNPSELPQKENDHGPDALRYLVLHMKYGLQKDDKLPKSSMVSQLNEYGI